MSSSIEKMSFNPNPDPLKQAQEVIVLRKINKPIIVIQNFQRQFSLKSFLTKNSWECFLMVNLILMNILKEYLKLVNVLVLCEKLRNFLPISSLLEIYKSFVRPYLDYRYIICDKALIGSFQQNRESIQYDVALAITGAMSGTSGEVILGHV